MNPKELLIERDYNFKLPANFKFCEGCKYFDALLDGEANCYLFGRIKGVQLCNRKEDGRYVIEIDGEICNRND